MRESETTLVYRARRNTDSRAVVIKATRSSSPPSEVARLRREHEILARFDDDGIIRPVGFETFADGHALVLEDSGGVSLRHVLDERGSLDLASFMRIAAAITRSLELVHAAGVIHKNVTPNAILTSPGFERVTLADFGVAATTSHALQRVEASGLSEGALRYMSPEQTGRTGRGLDYRADLYALGVTFFHLLSGQVPFASTDPLEVVHCHLARTPVRLDLLRRDVPEALASVVAMLMAKDPEDRYQSARGLLADLRLLTREPAPVGFVPGSGDASEQLRVPEIVVGRDAEYASMLAAVERCAEGAVELLLVTGPSGIGKSSLIRALERPTATRRGYFVEGKSDPRDRDTPYKAMIEALSVHVRQLQREPAELVVDRREALLSALGSNAQVLIDVVPELQELLGPQPPAPDLPPTESANRFRAVLGGFVRALAGPRHPIVLFLDDLQWSDPSSLKLIRQLLADGQLSHMLWICAVRDGEVPRGHPIYSLGRTLGALGVASTSISLDALSPSATKELVRATLRRDDEATAPLAERLHEVTAGSPLYLRTLLRSLAEQGVLRFDASTRRWSWDPAALASAQLGDGVDEVLAQRLGSLDARVRHAVERASCIGRVFELRTLSALLDRPEKEAQLDLVPVVELGLLEVLESRDSARGSWRYRFTHDRAHQGAYKRLTDEARAATHLRLGRLLLRRTPGQGLEGQVFTIVDHLIRGLGRIETERERVDLAGLCLLAGQRATRSLAYDAAVAHLRRGLELLPEDPWRDHHELAFALSRGLMEATYLDGRYDDAEPQFRPLLHRARTQRERTEVFELKIAIELARKNNEDAVLVATEGLRELGVDFPRHISRAFAMRELLAVRWRLWDREPEDLLSLARDPTEPTRDEVKLLAAAIPAAYFTDTWLSAAMLLRVFRLGLEHGFYAHSVSGVVGYGLFLAGVAGQYMLAERYAQLGLRLSQYFKNPWLYAKVNFQAGLFILPWVQPFAEARALLTEGSELGLQNGDFSYAMYCSAQSAFLLYQEGAPLPRLMQYAERTMPMAAKLGERDGVAMMMVLRQMCDCLRGSSVGVTDFSTATWSESEFVASLDRSVPVANFYYHVLKLTVAYLGGEHERAEQAALSARALLESALGQPMIVEHTFIEALNLAALYDVASVGERRRYRRRLVALLRQLATWAQHCPENFAARHLIAAGELARVRGRPEHAFMRFHEAIESSRRVDAPQLEALACELAARVCFQRGSDRVGNDLLAASIGAYERWGATAKAEALRARLLPHLPSRARTSSAINDSAIATSSSALDVGTVVKASRALSQEVSLERVLENLVRVVMVNAGAERCVLVLAKRGALFIEADGHAERGVEILPSKPVTGSSDLPEALVEFVARARTDVLLPDACNVGEYRDDPYISSRRVRSVLCTPIVRQRSLTGVVYLENNLATSVFTRARLELLKQLAAQIAASVENARLTKSFSRFVPHAFLQQLERESIVDVGLGDQVQREMTVLFSDIRDFTTLSEELTAQQTFDFINEYVAVMEPVIAASGGFIDKYIGDAIMALFPGRAEDAITAGLAMLRALEEFNAARRRAGAKPVRIGIGINTGTLILGTVGSRNRMEGTVISDAVNVASRIEGLTKQYEVALLISESTRAALARPEDFQLRRVDRVRVKGRGEPVTIYEVLQPS
ncbi:MAG: AAA family ATPase [Myxococcales bacterium]|nr:AAA family ATPase [Myxococcales bacterium]